MNLNPRVTFLILNAAFMGIVRSGEQLHAQPGYFLFLVVHHRKKQKPFSSFSPHVLRELGISLPPKSSSRAA